MIKRVLKLWNESRKKVVSRTAFKNFLGSHLVSIPLINLSILYIWCDWYDRQSSSMSLKFSLNESQRPL